LTNKLQDIDHFHKPINGRFGEKNAIPPLSAFFWRHKISRQVLMTKTAEGIAQRGLYDFHAQAKKHFSAE